MKERENNTELNAIVGAYTQILGLIGMEETEATSLSTRYLRTVLRKTGQSLATDEAQREVIEGITEVGELNAYLNENFDPMEVALETGKQYISFYGLWNERVLPLLSEEKRATAQGILNELASKLSSTIKENG